jgi:hypothetical protein
MFGGVGVYAIGLVRSCTTTGLYAGELGLYFGEVGLYAGDSGLDEQAAAWVGANAAAGGGLHTGEAG